jgi:hypothetical protein
VKLSDAGETGIATKAGRKAFQAEVAQSKRGNCTIKAGEERVRVLVEVRAVAFENLAEEFQLSLRHFKDSE